MTVEEMGNAAGITRQTMYDYLKRWIDLDIITKTTYIYEGKMTYRSSPFRSAVTIKYL